MNEISPHVGALPAVVKPPEVQVGFPPAVTGPDWFSVRRVSDVIEVTITGDISIYGSQTADDLIALIAAAGDAPVELIINSAGGDSRTAWTIYEGLLGRVRRATIIEKCYSAALTIALSAAWVRIEASARIMAHAGRAFVFGHAEELVDATSCLSRANAGSIDLLARRCGRENAELWLSGPDFYFTSESAEAVGLVDEIFSLPSLPTPSLVPAVVTPGPTEDEAAFLQVLRAFGTITVRNRAAFTRECAAWLMQNSREEG